MCNSDPDSGVDDFQSDRRLAGLEKQKISMKEKLKSRKLWMAVGGLLTVCATEWLNLDPKLADSLIGAVVIIVPAYIGGQSIVDALKEYSAK